MKFFNPTTVLAKFILLGLAANSSAYCAQPMDWQFHNVRHSMVDRIISPQAQHGDSLAVLDTTQLDFQESYADAHDLQRRELVKLGLASPYLHNSYFYNSQPLSFLYQTFNAKEYKGKHIHVSAFAKNIEPDFEALEAWYEEQYSLWQESELMKSTSKVIVGSESQQERVIVSENSEQRKIEALEEFSKYIRSSYENSSFEVKLVLYRRPHIEGKTTIQAISPTSSSSNDSSTLWNRFNIEIGIPLDCYAISLVLESRGLNKVYFDHIALVEHGKRLTESRVRYANLSPYFVTHIKENFEINDRGFQNLSFER